MALQPRGVIRSGVDLLDIGVDNLDLLVTGQGTFLIAHTGRNGGFVSYRLPATGAVTVQQTRIYGSDVQFASGAGQEIVRWNGETVLFFGANGAELVGYRLNDDGSFGAVRRAAWSAMDSAIASGQTQMLTAWTMLTDRAPAVLATQPTTTATVAMAPVQMGSISYLLAIGGGAAQVDSLRLGGTSAQQVSTLGMMQGLGIQTPTALEVISLQGQTFAILASAGSNSISVMQLRTDGTLIPTDHVIDTRHTRFQAVQDLSVARLGDHVFVVAGGGDQGLSLFQLLPDGRLVYRDSVADTAAWSLHNVTAVRAVAIGGDIHIFAGSQRDSGLTQFVVPGAGLGQVLRASGAITTGTAGADVIMAGADGDTLRGGGGDDILVAGPGRTWMAGQAGANTFVMRAASGVTHLLDFQRGTDRLDLSDWLLLRSTDQLALTPTAQGARLSYRTHTVEITAADGRPLGMADLFPQGLTGPDRILVLLPEFAQTLPGPPTPTPTPNPTPAPALPVVSLAPLSPNVTEGDAGTVSATFRVTLSAAAAGPVTVNWAVTGTFSGQPLPSGALTIAAGQTQATLSLPVQGDLISEPVSNFTVTLSNPQGATLGTASASGRITDDDPVLIARADAAAAIAAGAVVTGNVLSNDQGKGLVVANPVTGQAGALGTLTLGANGAYSYTPNRAQALPQGVTGTDTFNVTVRDASGATQSAALTVTVTGVNDPATITGPRTATVAMATPSSWQPAGRLAITDPDTGEARFAPPQSTRGTYGAFSFDPAGGGWGYALDASLAAVRALAPGQVVTDRLTVRSLDGTASAQIAITITGPPPPPAEPAGGVALRQAVAGAVDLAGTQVVFTATTGARYSTQTDARGQFDLALPPGTAGTLELVRSYSTGVDKMLTVMDVIALFNIVAGRAPPAALADARHILAADYNANGSADITDVIALFRHVAGQPGGNAPAWIFVADDDMPAVSMSRVPLPGDLSVFEGVSHDAFTGILRGDLAGYF